jgi:hypothetical protein
MKTLRLVAAYLPHVFYSVMTLVLTISFSFVLIALSSHLPPNHLGTIFSDLNTQRKFSEILLVLIPLGCVYIFLSLKFAVYVGRKKTSNIDVPDIILIPCFMLPILALLAAQSGMTISLFTHENAALKAEDFAWVTSTVVTAIAAMFWVEVFMSFCKAISHARAGADSPVIF